MNLNSGYYWRIHGVWTAAMIVKTTVRMIGATDRIAGKRRALLDMTSETVSRTHVKTTVAVMTMTRRYLPYLLRV
jgi:hypothetical protein